jgi:hypothetical protein
MSKRREFSSNVRAEIRARATNEAGQVCCEGCGTALKQGDWDFDHTIAEELVIHKGRKLTASDGKLLGRRCCHASKTRLDKAIIAQAKRRQANHFGTAATSKRPIPSPPKRGRPKRDKPDLPGREGSLLYRMWQASHNPENLEDYD